MKHFEIERRFVLYPCSVKRLLRELGVTYEAIPIRQFYLVAEKERTERYRQAGKRYILTRKKGQGLCREEEEITIDRARFEKALAQNRGGVIKKVRYRFRYEGRLYELDRFKKRLKGLNILEIEFASQQEARAFALPAGLARAVAAEVTESGAFTNAALSRAMRVPSLPVDRTALLTRVETRGDFLKASVRVELAPFMPGVDAARALIHSLVLSARANRAAILAGDCDPERLHQLRVAMRKMRALLGEMEAPLDREWAKARKRRLAELMRRTGAKRDVDVYLARMEAYRQMLPARYHGGLAELERYLRALERQEAQRLLAFLRGPELEEELTRLERFARAQSGEGVGERSDEPLIFEAKRALKRHYRRVARKGGAIDADAPPHRYHKVRIEVKKLRYLMEFCASVFEPEAYETMLRRLKAIQTILGDHQDLDVQRAHLKAFLDRSELQSAEVAEAIGALREVMAKLEAEKRRAFRKLFAEFDQSAPLRRRMVCHY